MIMSKLNLPIIFKELCKIKKTNREAFAIISELLSEVAQSEFACKSYELQISKNFWGWGWNVYESSHGKRIDSREYHEKLRAVFKEKGELGQQEFFNEYKEVYDYKIYEEHVEKLKKISLLLEELGFKIRMIYSKDYKKCSLEKGPESLWLIVSY